jgi:hypothetical protein
MNWKAHVVVGIAVLVGACSGAGVMEPPEAGARLAGDRDTGAAFQTDSLVYTLVRGPQGIEGRIGYVFTNPTDAPVYIVNCRAQTALRLQKHTDAGWIDAWSPVVLDCLSPPIVVPPGDRRADEVPVFAGAPGSNVHPQFLVDRVPGVYRIVWHHVLSSYDDRRYPFGEPLPLEQRVSNRFELREIGR